METIEKRVCQAEVGLAEAMNSAIRKVCLSVRRLASWQLN